MVHHSHRQKQRKSCNSHSGCNWWC